MSIKKLLESDLIYYLFSLILLFIFFTQIHPLVPFDSDDWEYLITDRGALPALRNWNPSKVLPECLHAIVGAIAAFLVNPIIKDFFYSVIYTHAAVVSLFLILYLYSTQRLLEWKFKIGKTCSHVIICIFSLLHFLILRTQNSNNEYLWFSHDCTCYYHYIIPSLLCTSLVMWLIRHDPKELKRPAEISILLFVTYLALFSSLYSNIVLVVFVGTSLLIDFLKIDKNTKKWFIQFCKNKAYYFLVILLWFVVLWYEGHGRRGNSYGYLHAPLLVCVKQTISYFIHIRYNIKFILLVLGILVCAKFYDWKNVHKKWYYVGHLQIILLLSLCLSAIYLILLSSRVDFSYITRGDVILSYAFFLLLLVAFGLAYLCSNFKIAKIISPMIIFFIFFEINTNNNVFKDVQNEHNLNAQKCLELSKDLVDQTRMADAAGLDSAIIYIPRYGQEDNWPLSIYTSENFGITLYKYGITKRKITTIFKTKSIE